MLTKNRAFTVRAMVIGLTLVGAIRVGAEDVAPLIRLPSTPPPPGGWPVMIMLHGRGSNAQRFVGFADAVTRAGIVAVIPTGPVELARDRYAWHPDVASNERYLRTALQAAARRSDVDDTRTVLGGFSQGASVAIQLAARDPGSWQGVLAVSPVGAVKSADADASNPPALHVIVGSADEASMSSARAAERAWREADWPVSVDTHPGGHAPPDDWPGRLERASRALLQRAR